MKDNLQVENGGYLRIVNPLFDRLIQVHFKGCELNVAMFIIRKTYGFNKTEDEISISQIMKGVNRTRQTVVTALKNLQLVNIVRLVKRGNSINSSNVYGINKYSDSWQLVNTARLVKRNRGTSLIEPPQLVKTARHTIDNTKDNTKDSVAKATEGVSFSLEREIQKLLDSKRDDLKIIGLYISYKDFRITTQVEFNEILKLNLRPAKSLASFKGKVEDTMISEVNKAKQTILEKGHVDYEWKLTTILKRLS